MLSHYLKSNRKHISENVSYIRMKLTSSSRRPSTRSSHDATVPSPSSASGFAGLKVLDMKIRSFLFCCKQKKKKRKKLLINVLFPQKIEAERSRVFSGCNRQKMKLHPSLLLHSSLLNYQSQQGCELYDII